MTFWGKFFKIGSAGKPTKSQAPMLSPPGPWPAPTTPPTPRGYSYIVTAEPEVPQRGAALPEPGTCNSRWREFLGLPPVDALTGREIAPEPPTLSCEQMRANWAQDQERLWLLNAELTRVQEELEETRHMLAHFRQYPNGRPYAVLCPRCSRPYPVQLGRDGQWYSGEPCCCPEEK